MKRFLTISMLLTLGACMPVLNGEERALSVQERHPIEVSAEDATLHIAVEPGQTQLTAEDRYRINEFASLYRMKGHGFVNIDMPMQSGNAFAASKVAEDVKRNLAQLGLTEKYLQTGAYDGSADGAVAPIILRFTHYVASTKECGDWSKNLGFSPRNLPHPNHGCATQNNLAAVLEDPHDLIAPRGMTPSDVQRRTTVLEKYREGESSGTERTDEESGAISDAIGDE